MSCGRQSLVQFHDGIMPDATEASPPAAERRTRREGAADRCPARVAATTCRSPPSVATACRTPARRCVRRYRGHVFAPRIVLTALALAGCTPRGSSADGSDSSTSTPTGGASGTTDAGGTTASAADCTAESNDLFNKRIAPLLATDRPKTCNTCHLSGVDLAMFVQEDACQTMACLDARGLVDLSDPASSVVLQWISRADPASPLIDQKVIDEEHSAFLAWIESTAECGLCYTGATPCGEPVESVCAADDPEEDAFVDPGDCSPVTREALFRHKVYAWRDRCYPCHFDNKEFEAPKWITTGACDLASLGTMRNVLDTGLIDYQDPAASLLLLKPLAESAGGVVHGGDDKFHDLDDPAYLDFRSWIEREVACTP